MSVETLTNIELARTVRLGQLVLGTPSGAVNYNYTLFFWSKGKASVSGTVSSGSPVSTSLKSLCDGLGVSVDDVRDVRIRAVSNVYWSEGYDPKTAVTTALTVTSDIIYAGQAMDIGDGRVVLSAPSTATSPVREVSAAYVNRTSSGQVLAVPGEFLGYHVNSTSSGVIKFWDNTAASGTAITGNITPAAGSCPAMPPVAVSTGLYFQLVSGTIDITIFYRGA